jgi:hypothetical protein
LVTYDNTYTAHILTNHTRTIKEEKEKRELSATDFRPNQNEGVLDSHLHLTKAEVLKFSLDQNSSFVWFISTLAVGGDRKRLIRLRIREKSRLNRRAYEPGKSQTMIGRGRDGVYNSSMHFFLYS